jgi:hypothetical protein
VHTLSSRAEAFNLENTVCEAMLDGLLIKLDRDVLRVLLSWRRGMGLLVRRWSAREIFTRLPKINVATRELVDAVEKLKIANAGVSARKAGKGD